MEAMGYFIIQKYSTCTRTEFEMPMQDIECTSSGTMATLNCMILQNIKKTHLNKFISLHGNHLVPAFKSFTVFRHACTS